MAYVTCGSNGECEYPATGRPVCHKHRVRARRASLGDPATLAERFWSKVDRSDTDGACWLWTAALNNKGYGLFETKGAHRVAYELAVGPIPDGLQIDHLCMVTRCVNPAHLEPVTQEENMRRRYAAQTACRRGHEFTPENTYYSPKRPDVRQCRECSRDRYRREKAPHLLGLPPGSAEPKTHCRNGHEFTPENTYLYQSRNRDNPRRECRTCMKERLERFYARRLAI